MALEAGRLVDGVSDLMNQSAAAADQKAADSFVPAEGRSVVYQLAEGEYRPAQIVRVWAVDAPKTVNLVVFVDGSNDARHLHQALDNLAANPTLWKTSVVLGAGVGQYLPRKPAA